MRISLPHDAVPPALTVPRGIRRRQYKNQAFTFLAHRARLARYLVTTGHTPVISDSENHPHGLVLIGSALLWSQHFPLTTFNSLEY